MDELGLRENASNDERSQSDMDIALDDDQSYLDEPSILPADNSDVDEDFPDIESESNGRYGTSDEEDPSSDILNAEPNDHDVQDINFQVEPVPDIA
ncbi:hypothetical protein H4219_006431, partial [Mycoemilia scoparia]